MNTRADFHFDGYYHVYNRTNNKEALFRTDENRAYFLRQYKKYLGPYVDVFAYALMSNHFHFSIKVKNQIAINSHIDGLHQNEVTVPLRKYRDRIASSDAISLPLPISEVLISQYRRFFISYTQAINQRYNRQGNLFADRFKRSQYNPHEKFRYLHYYIHHNGRKHGVVKDFRDYLYHSYQEIVTGQSDLIDRSSVLEWYDDLAEFKAFHEATHYEDVFGDLDMDGFI